MHPRRAVATAPASIANLGPLYDIAAMAVDAGYARVEAVLLEELGDKIIVECDGPPVLERAAQRILEYLGETVRVRVRLIDSTIPVGVGLGSSGAIAAAGAVAVNALLDEPFTREELVRFAGEAEAAAAGTPHYDNVAASIMGGLALVLDPERPLVTRLEPPEDTVILLFIPEGEVVKPPSGMGKTEYMRSLLPRTLTLEEHVEWTRDALRLATLLEKNPLEALRAANNGWLVEEARGKVIPGYREAKEAALEAGAIAFNISGAGPTLYAITTEETRDRVATRVEEILAAHWPGVRVVEARPDTQGARLE